MPIAQEIEQALNRVRDKETFISDLLVGALEWPVPDNIEDIGFEWSQDELRAKGLQQQVKDGKAFQIHLRHNQAWGIFLLEFHKPDALVSGRGLTGPLRKVLRGLVASRDRAPHLPAFARKNLLFICTHAYRDYRFAYFKSPPEGTKTAPLATFGWESDNQARRTVCEFNLPDLAWPDHKVSDAEWTQRWATAFDVKKVTEKFYKDFEFEFNKLRNKINGLGADTEDQKIFTQTLLNRLMFLRFVERKGWLKSPGGSEKAYLRSLFAAGRYKGKSFYNGRLKPLFFEGLAISGKQQSEAFGKSSFLNGGLFEAISGLDDKVDDIPDEAFAPIISDNGLFYRYNFTVEESTPLDIEVAVDPEMLGQVFEKLVTDRDKSGSYYTPRPVVSYMCREALKGFLAGQTSASLESIQSLIDKHEVLGLTEIHGKQILAALDSLKAVDPACGSGAYLLGLLQELIAIYRLLYSERLVRDARSLYELKLRIISHNLYGVDIARFATGIAMLRLWLSLAVEADEPLPLPNLNFKIETGDSLTGPDPSAMPDLFREKLQRDADALVAKKDEFLNCHDQTKAAKLAEIRTREELIAKTLNVTIGVGIIDWRIHFAEVFAGQAAIATVDGRFPFANDVAGGQRSFTTGGKRGGFDIVLANPPYGASVEGFVRDRFFDRGSEGAQSKDTYGLFIARGLQLLRANGHLCYIVSDTWRTIRSHRPLRQRLLATATVSHIIDLPQWIFQATVNTSILTLSKKIAPPNHSLIAGDLRGIDRGDWKTLADNLKAVAEHGPDIRERYVNSTFSSRRRE